MNRGQLDSAYKYMAGATSFPANNPMPESREYYFRRDTCFKWAILLTEKMVLKNDTVPGYFCNLGLLHKELGYRREAIVFFTKAIMLDSTRYIDFYNRGLTYRELNLLDSAAADYTMSLKINPKNANTYLNRGFLYLKLEEYDKAIYDFERVPRYSEQHGVCVL
jgi:tetratricopeptide (TPR) repeat protein